MYVEVHLLKMIAEYVMEMVHLVQMMEVIHVLRDMMNVVYAVAVVLLKVHVIVMEIF